MRRAAVGGGRLWKKIEPPIKGQGSLFSLSMEELKRHVAVSVDTGKGEKMGPDLNPEL